MPKIPQYTAQQVPSGEVPAVKLPYSVVETGEGAKWAGLANLGQDVSQVAMDIQNTRNEAELSKLERENNIKWESVWNTIQTTRDPVARDNLYKKFITDTTGETAKIKNRWVKHEYQLKLNRAIPEWTYHYNNINRRMVLEDAKVEIETSIEYALQRGDYEQYKEDNKRKYTTGLQGQKEYELTNTEAYFNAKREPYAVVEIAEQAFELGDKKLGMELIEKSNLSFEGKRQAENKLADRWAQLEKQSENNIVQTYEQFADKLADGTFTTDDVALSKLNKEEKKEWEERAASRRLPPPQKSSYEGSKFIAQTVLAYSNGEIGKKEAIENIVSKRYDDKAITDDVYKFAIEKLKNPYPKHIVQTVRGILKSSEDQMYYQGVGILGKDWLDSREKEQLVAKNTAFLSWLNAEAQDGKYPDGKAMYGKMRELGITLPIPENLPKPQRAIPKKADANYITTDEAYDKLPSGTEFYDGIMGVWRKKP